MAFHSPISNPQSPFSTLSRSLKNLNLWIVAALLITNGLAWALTFTARGPAHVVEPELDPDLADLRERLIAGTHHGESFEAIITNLEAEQTLTWYLDRHPNVPFRHPQVAIHPDGIEVWGEAHVAGLRVGLEGRANVVLRDGVPIATVEHLGMAGVSIPHFVRRRIQAEIDQQLALAHDLPVIIETFELQEGQVTASGTIR
jgi:hypothetical protein